MKKKNNYGKFLITLLLFSISFCAISKAELVENRGLPNREGVKADPLRQKLTNSDLPDRTGFEVDPIVMHAAFKTEVQFDTNVFLEETGEDFDVVTILAPSMGLELPIGDHNFSADYELKANIFGIHTSHSYIDQSIRGLAEINLTDYKLTFANVYRRFSDRAGSEDVTHVKRQNNYMRAGVGTLLEQLQFDVGYTFGVENFIDDEVIYTTLTDSMSYHDKDRFLNVFDGTISYRFLPKTTLLLETYLGFIKYRNNKSSDSWFTESMIGLKGELTSKILTNLSAGVRYQDYREARMTTDKDFIGLVVRGGATYNITKDDKIDLLLERNVYESMFNNMNYYNVNHAGLNYTHFFNKKISSRIFGYYQLNLYPEKATVGGLEAKRNDQIFGLGAAFRYDINKWASVDIEYQHKKRRSHFHVYNFSDDLITLNGTIGF